MVITPRRGFIHLDLGELWRYRELGYFLAWRDIKVRYKQTVIGAAWAVLNPIIMMVVFTFVFGKGRGGGGPRGVPAPLWYFAGLLPWTYFSQSIQNASASVLGAQQVIKKIYYPRLILPLEAVFPGIVDFLMSFAVLVILMLAYGEHFTLRLLILPIALLLTVFTAFGAGTWLSAMNALYRDIREGVPFLVQILLFTSPILLNPRRIPQWFRPIYGLNPMVSVIEMTRWAVTGKGVFPFEVLWPGIGFLVFMTITGIVFFHRVEDVVVDVV
jgi:lipopolysaccharide transport system permease protein